jgi:hypothetical protein
VRTASIATLMCMAFMFTGASAGNFEDIDWILSSADAIRCDSEALDDSKMMRYSMKNFIHMQWAWYSDDNTTLFERWENISVTANKLFPKTVIKAEGDPFLVLNASLMLAPVALSANDPEAALDYIRTLFSQRIWMMFYGSSGNSVYEVQQIMPASVLRVLHEMYTGRGDTQVVNELVEYMHRLRAMIEQYQKISPGSYCASGVAVRFFHEEQRIFFFILLSYLTLYKYIYLLLFFVCFFFSLSIILRSFAHRVLLPCLLLWEIVI